jgi:hypothetical protein
MLRVFFFPWVLAGLLAAIIILESLSFGICLHIPISRRG